MFLVNFYMVSFFVYKNSFWFDLAMPIEVLGGFAIVALHSFLVANPGGEVRVRPCANVLVL